VQVEFTPPFLRQLKRIRKKYPSVQSDVQPLIDQLEGGETPGVQIRGVKYTVYKARVRNSDASSGKSGGYRVIYYIKTSHLARLVYIYSKAEQTDIKADEIRRMIEELS
jgi:mRNA-degrading endonuclease RelE of RelBE toxin-antitoxin system